MNNNTMKQQTNHKDPTKYFKIFPKKEIVICWDILLYLLPLAALNILFGCYVGSIHMILIGFAFAPPPLLYLTLFVGTVGLIKLFMTSTKRFCPILGTLIIYQIIWGTVLAYNFESTPLLFEFIGKLTFVQLLLLSMVSPYFLMGLAGLTALYIKLNSKQ